MTMSVSTPPGTWSKAGAPSERQKLRDDVPKVGLAATVRGRTVFEIASEMLKLARAGLAAPQASRRRADETRRTILKCWKTGSRAAPRRRRSCLEKFNGPWAGSVDPIYTEEAY